MNATYYISHLQLLPHPEGGFYRETYRSAEAIASKALAPRFDGDRSFSTAIYYLLQQGDYSGFHKIKSDECWHFYAGGTLLIHCISSTGDYTVVKLGNNAGVGEVFQYVVPAETWFASEPAGGTAFCLAGCTVAPGFDFEDFTMADKARMLHDFPQHPEIIKRLCR